MKISRFYFILFFCIVNLYNCQEFTSKYEIIYQFDWQRDSTNVYSRVKEQMVLYVGEKKSLLRSLVGEKQDSIINNFKYEQGAVINYGSLSRPKFDFTIIKNYHTKDKVVFLENLGNIQIGYYDEMNDLIWKLLPDTRMVQGYKCQKAISRFRGRNYIAWFTNEIPVNDGPYKFGGLPGLILLLNDDENQFNFEIVRLLKKEKKITYKTNFELIKRTDYYNKKLNFYNSYRNSIVGKNSEKPKEIVYNPIEKY